MTKADAPGLPTLDFKKNKGRKKKLRIWPGNLVYLVRHPQPLNSNSNSKNQQIGFT